MASYISSTTDIMQTYIKEGLAALQLEHPAVGGIGAPAAQHRPQQGNLALPLQPASVVTLEGAAPQSQVRLMLLQPAAGGCRRRGLQARTAGRLMHLVLLLALPLLPRASPTDISCLLGLLSAQLVAMKAGLEARDRQLAALRAEVAARDRQLADRQEEVDYLEDEVMCQREKVAKLQDSNAALQVQLAALANHG